MAGAATVFPLRAARWVTPGADLARILSQKPAECLAKVTDKNEAYLVEVGRAAFNTPLTLGGQASRAGLQCESCHRGGRTNPDFAFPGVSGKPGTVDVTTSVFSSHRGDGIDNPKPIPDLSGPRDKLKLSRDPGSPELKTFIHGIVTQEFDGAEPPASVLNGLVAYVRALQPSACPKNPVAPIRMAGVMQDALRAAGAADMALARKDAPTAILMLASARTQLGLVYERYADPKLAPERAALATADLDLESIQDGVRNHKDVSARLAIWQAGGRRLIAVLARREDLSLFAPEKLKQAVAASRKL